MTKPIAVLGTAGTVASSWRRATGDVFQECGQNTGNLAFQYATWKSIADEKIAFPFAFDPEEIASECRAICVPSANFLYAQFDLGELADRLERTRLPLIVIGLGAQAMRSIDEVVLKPGTRRLLDLFAERCSRILVRGHYTAEVVQRLGVRNFEIFGCPSNLINPMPDLGARIGRQARERRSRIAYAPTFYSYNSEFELDLLSLIGPRLSMIVAQDPQAAVALARGDRAPDLDAWLAERSGLLARLDPSRRAEAVSLLRTYFSCEAWLEAYRGADGVVATRIHGASVGWQACRPSILVSYDLRTEELAATMGLPWIKSDALGAAPFDEVFADKVAEACVGYDALRVTQARQLVAVLEDAGLKAAPELRALGELRLPATAAEPSRQPQQIRSWGFLEKYNRDRIGGWVASDATDAPSVIIRVGGREIATIRPDKERPDIGGNSWGFDIPLPADALSSEVMAVEAVFASTGQHLRNSPVINSFAVNDRDKVLKGQAGWLFLANDTNRTLDQITGRRLLTDGERDAWAEFLISVDNLAGRRGIQALYVVAPNKECVFARHLPNDVPFADHRIISQLRSLVDELRLRNVRLMYPLELLASEHPHATYSYGDTHWTDYGAALVTDEILATLKGVESSNFGSGDFRIEFRNTDLRSKLGGTCVEPMPVRIRQSAARCVSNNGRINTGRSQTFRSERDDARGRLLFIHDSFGEWLTPFLAERFEETTTLWSSSFPADLIESVRPTVLLFERAERFLLVPPPLVHDLSPVHQA